MQHTAKCLQTWTSINVWVKSISKTHCCANAWWAWCCSVFCFQWCVNSTVVCLLFLFFSLFAKAVSITFRLMSWSSFWYLTPLFDSFIYCTVDCEKCMMPSQCQSITCAVEILSHCRIIFISFYEYQTQYIMIFWNKILSILFSYFFIFQFNTWFLRNKSGILMLVHSY